MDELNLAHDPSQFPHLLRQDFTTVLTAALVRGLQLYVSSSIVHADSSSSSSSSTRAAHPQEHQDGVPPASGARYSSSTLQHGQDIPPLADDVQDTYQCLSVISVTLSHWYSIYARNCGTQENKDIYTTMLTSGEN